MLLFVLFFMEAAKAKGGDRLWKVEEVAR